MKKSGQTNTSVVVTVLNEGKTIADLLDALINQSAVPSEVLIVDGGSTDNTLKILLEYQNRKLPFSLLQLIKVGNRSVGRNQGITKAKNELIAITDAGCIPHSNWLESLLEKHITPVVAGYYDAQPRNSFEEAVIPYVFVMPDKVNPQNFLPATRSMLIEKAAWKKVGGFDETLSDNEDYAFAHRLKNHHIPITFSQDAKVTWQPPHNLLDFYRMIFRFARGDVQAGILRKKVVALFTRYFIGLVVICFLLLNRSILILPVFLAIYVNYTLWAILKNQKYTPMGWYWLPTLQYTADLAVILGSLSGLIRKLK